MKCRAHSVPVEQSGLAVCDNKAGLGPQQLTLMLEHELKLADSDICLQQEEIHSGDWLLGDGVLKEQGCCFCDCSLEEKEKIIQTRVETCCFT